MRSLLLLIILNLILIIRQVSGSNEPLMDILKNYDKVTQVTNLCSQHLAILRDEIKSDENWALKGEPSILQRKKFTVNFLIIILTF